MAIPKKTQWQIEELKASGTEIKEILQGLRNKEGVPERIIKDLEQLAEGYDKEILKTVYGIDVR